jgi:hypothetical protein
VSVRGQVGGAWFSVARHPFEGRVAPAQVTGNMGYNWEHGHRRPFETARRGVYRFR